jgi:hypothetical protein
MVHAYWHKELPLPVPKKHSLGATRRVFLRALVLKAESFGTASPLLSSGLCFNILYTLYVFCVLACVSAHPVRVQ